MSERRAFLEGTGERLHHLSPSPLMNLSQLLGYFRSSAINTFSTVHRRSSKAYVSRNLKVAEINARQQKAIMAFVMRKNMKPKGKWWRFVSSLVECRHKICFFLLQSFDSVSKGSRTYIIGMGDCIPVRPWHDSPIECLAEVRMIWRDKSELLLSLRLYLLPENTTKGRVGHGEVSPLMRTFVRSFVFFLSSIFETQRSRHFLEWQKYIFLSGKKITCRLRVLVETHQN